MKTVWKYVLEIRDLQEITMPVGAQFLHVAEQSGERDGPERTLLLWALVDKDAPREQHLIQISGTGHPIEEPGSHIGSVTDHGLVWHVFDGLRGDHR